MPMETEPPRKGTLTIKDLLTLHTMDVALIMSAKNNTPKIAHSFLEKVARAAFILSFFGNVKFRIRLKIFSIMRIITQTLLETKCYISIDKNANKAKRTAQARAR